MFVVEQRDRIVIDVGEFHGSSVFGITQLQWRLKEPKKEGMTAMFSVIVS